MVPYTIKEDTAPVLQVSMYASEGDGIRAFAVEGGELSVTLDSRFRLGVGDHDRLYKNSTVDGACRWRSQVSKRRYGASSGQFWVALYSRTRRRGRKGNREPQLEFRGFPQARVDRGSLRGTLDGPTTTREDDAINPKVPLSKGSMWKMKAPRGT